MTTARDILDRFGVQHPPSSAAGRYYATCPRCSASRSTKAHQEAKVLSVTIDHKGVVFACNHCDWVEGVSYNSKGDGAAFNIITIYNYVDEDGEILFQVCRTADKTFPQRRPNGNGGWTWGTKGVRKVLFHLNEVMEAIANEHPIFVVEGEKDVLSLERIGIVATCNPGGASEPGKKSKWKKEYSDALRGADIVVVPDNDPPGYAHADAICRMSAGVAKSVHTLKLVDHWPECKQGGDISDWLEAGHTREQLDELIARAQPWAASSESAEQEEVNNNLLLDPINPMPSARKIVALHFTDENELRTLQRHRRAFWWHKGSYYRLTDDETLRARIWEVLETAHQPVKDGTAPFKPTHKRVAEVLEALNAVTQLDEHIDPPAWLHPGPAPANEFFACANGLLHLPSGKLYALTPSYFGLTASEVVYDPSAPEPVLWLKFLDEVLSDGQTIDTAQEWFGYMLVPDTAQQKILLAIGPKRSGKGTAARILTKLLGSASVGAPTMNTLGGLFGLEALITKSLAIISDARIGQRTDKSVIVERLLSVSGEDKIDVDRKFMKAWTGKLLTRIMILTNELPGLTDGSGALASRFILILFPNSFYGKEDIALTNRLATELSGILNWAIAGYRHLQQRGHFVQPENAAAQLDTIEMLGAPVRAFIRDCCETAPGLEIEVSKLYQAWATWCRLEGRRDPGTKEWFGRNLHSAIPGLKVNKGRTDDSAEQVRKYVGVNLAPRWKEIEEAFQTEAQSAFDNF